MRASAFTHAAGQPGARFPRANPGKKSQRRGAGHRSRPHHASWMEGEKPHCHRHFPGLRFPRQRSGYYQRAHLTGYRIIQAGQPTSQSISTLLHTEALGHGNKGWDIGSRPHFKPGDSPAASLRLSWSLPFFTALNSQGGWRMAKHCADQFISCQQRDRAEKAHSGMGPAFLR